MDACSPGVNRYKMSTSAYIYLTVAKSTFRVLWFCLKTSLYPFTNDYRRLLTVISLTTNALKRMKDDQKAK